MADLAVAAISTVLEDPLNIIRRTIILLLNVDISNELDNLVEMLKTAHRHRRADRDLADLAYKLLLLANDAKNLVGRIGDQTSNTPRSESCMDTAAISCRRFISQLPFKEDMRLIRRRISEIEPRVKSCLDRLRIQLGDLTTPVDEQRMSTWRPSYRFGDIVETFDDLFSAIVERLLQQQQQQHGGGDTGVAIMREKVIRIVGIGGLGKTALAKRICEDSSITDHFVVRLWPKTSENLSPIQTIKQILMLVNVRDEMPDDVATLLNMLSRSLNTEMRYLFVLDGATNTTDWDFLLNAFLSTGMGQSRILITTRTTHVAPYAITYQLQLTDEDGLQLFKSMVPAQDQLLQDKLGPEIVSFCMGLPSIISSVAVRLSSTQAEEDWRSVRDELEKDLIQSLDTAAESLSTPLKQCLYYFALFERGSNIPARRLINLLVAEGMVIPFGDDLPLEATAEEYLTDLVEQNWVQVVDRKPNGKVKTYRMHPFLMKYWLDKAQEDKFMDEKGKESNQGTAAHLSGDVQPTARITLSSITSTLRRTAAATIRHLARPSYGFITPIGIVESLIPQMVDRMFISPFLFDREEVGVHHLSDHLQDDRNHAHIHGYNSTGLAKFRARYQSLGFLISFDSREGSEPGEEIGKFLKRGIRWFCFKEMKVLDLERVFRPKLPKSIGELSNLRYLGLRWTYLKELPSSIDKLLLLHTLDLKHTYITELPKSLWKMRQLRHLYLSESYRTRFAPPPSSIYLTHLQTLWGAFLDDKIYSHLEHSLFQLEKIRKLGLTYSLLTPDQQKATAKWIADKLENLETLRLISINEEVKPSDLYIEPLSGLGKLSSIYLLGELSGPDSPLALDTLFPANLTELTLSFSGLETDPMPVLEKLQNLRVLGLLCKSFIGDSMSCSPGGFPVLQKLMLWNLDKLKTWTVTRGALRWLKELDIRSCAALDEVPEGLTHLKLVVELSIDGMSDRLASRLGEGGPDCLKIAHVEKVNVNFSPRQQQSGGN